MSADQSTDSVLGPVEVTYTVGDMFAVVGQSWRSLLKIVVVGEAVMIAVLAGLSIAFDGASLEAAVRWIPWKLLAALALIWLVAFAVLGPLIGYIQSKRQKVLGPNRFWLHEDGIQVENSAAKSLVYWSSIKRVVATNRRLYLFIRSRMAFSLPRRAFDSDAQFESFVMTAKQRWDARPRR